jgi:isoleucyl-tRNA synthetase
LRFFFITSSLGLADLSVLPDPGERTDVQGVDLDDGKAWVAAVPSDARKCIRCWHYRPDVGTHAEHPEICGRCIENVDGAGETRRWF